MIPNGQKKANSEITGLNKSNKHNPIKMFVIYLKKIYLPRVENKNLKYQITTIHCFWGLYPIGKFSNT